MNGRAAAPVKAGRVFLRIPANIPAKAVSGEDICCNAVVNNLSSDGLALVIEDMEAAKELPHFFCVSFRLPRSSRMLKLEVEEKSRREADGKVTVSCVITEASPQDRRLFNDHLHRATDLGLAYTLVDTAAFLCCADSLWRMTARAIYRYYAATPFGKDGLQAMGLSWYDAALFIYAAASFASFALLNGFIPARFSLRRYPISIALLCASALFLAIRMIGYLTGPAAAGGGLAKLFIGAQAMLVAYVIVSIASGALSIARVESVFSAIEKHA